MRKLLIYLSNNNNNNNKKLVYLSSTIAPKWLGQIATAGVGGKILLSGGRR